MATHRTSWAFLWVLHAVQTVQGQVKTCTSANNEACIPAAIDVSTGCATATLTGSLTGSCLDDGRDGVACFTQQTDTDGNVCAVAQGCECFEGVCLRSTLSGVCDLPPACPDGAGMCDDQHTEGLRGQTNDWSVIDGGWYSMVKDDNANLQVNVRLTVPLPEEFPDRQLITGLSVWSEGHSLVIEVNNPYDIDTNGCPSGISGCLANGGLRAVVDGEEVEDLLRFSRDEHVADGIIMSASNLPAECRSLGGGNIWTRMYDGVLLDASAPPPEETLEDCILHFADIAPNVCKQYIEQHNLADLQSTHAVFKIITSTVTVRLNVGTNYESGTDFDWEGGVLPDLECWQMDVGMQGLSLENESLSGMLREAARPLLEADESEMMYWYEEFRETVEDYRVSNPLGTDVVLLDKL